MDERPEGAPYDESFAPAPAPAPEPVAEMLEATVSADSAVERIVSAGLARIVTELDERRALDMFREKQIDRLHAELQEYKADVVAKAVRPVLMSMIRLHDDLGKVLDALGAEDQDAITAARALRLLEGFREDVELALDHNGVSTYRADGDEFDPRRQKVARTVEAGQKTQVGRIAERIRPGFEQVETILEKERVAVYVSAQLKPDQEVTQ